MARRSSKAWVRVAFRQWSEWSAFALLCCRFGVIGTFLGTRYLLYRSETLELQSF